MENSAPRLRQVLIVSDFAAVNGGQAKVAIDSARLLADSGIKVIFFAACGPVASELSHPDIRVICLDQRTILDDPNRLRAMAQGIWNDPAARHLRQIVAQMDPETDVLHCHGFAKALSPSIGPVLAKGPLRAVFTMHEYFLACPNGGFYDYRRQQICHKTPLGLSCLTTNCDSRRFSHKIWRVARAGVAIGPGRLPRGLRDIIYISATQKQAMAPYLPAQARLHHVPNPVSQGGMMVDVDRNQTLVFVGRLAPEKGGLHLAKAAKALGQPVMFVGDGPEAEAIRRANPDAQMMGWCTPAQVQNHLSQARALVFPSLWYEGQPLVPIEALLRGIPVVCGSWSAAAETVQNGINGIIYNQPTIPALTEALCGLPLIGDFDQQALAKMVAPPTHLTRLRAIYQEILAR